MTLLLFVVIGHRSEAMTGTIAPSNSRVITASRGCKASLRVPRIIAAAWAARIAPIVPKRPDNAKRVSGDPLAVFHAHNSSRVAA